MNAKIEKGYPSTYRTGDTQALSLNINRRQSVEIVGINRVGIGNFLRYYLNNDIAHSRFLDRKNHVFITVDLNDLTELSIEMLWQLTLKRIEDTLITHKELSALCTSFVKTNHHSHPASIFFTVERIRNLLKLVADSDYLPTVFFIRLDRMKDMLTNTFFNNLQGLHAATNNKFMFVSTSYRAMQELCPKCFAKNSSLIYLPKMYVKPAQVKDSKILLHSFETTHAMHIPNDIRSKLIEYSGGHVQYLQISLLLYDEIVHKLKCNKEQFLEKVLLDERINLQSEEIYGNLTKNEQDTLVALLHSGKKITHAIPDNSYLIETGLLQKTKVGYSIFNIYFEKYLRNIRIHKNKNRYLGFTTKEDLLLGVFLENRGKVCDRLTIQKVVWPECSEIGVSDWAIDRLVSRLRIKLRLNESPLKVLTIRSKGYMLS